MKRRQSKLEEQRKRDRQKATRIKLVKDEQLRRAKLAELVACYRTVGATL